MTLSTHKRRPARVLQSAVAASLLLNTIICAYAASSPPQACTRTELPPKAPTLPLIVDITLVDGTGTPLAATTPVDVEVVNQFDKHESTGPTLGAKHTFKLPYYGNAAAGVTVKAKAAGYEDMSASLPKVIKDRSHTAKLMILPERPQYQLPSWYQLQTCCGNVFGVLSRLQRNAQTEYEQRMHSAPAAATFLLITMAHLEAVKIRDVPVLTQLHAVDWSRPTTDSQFSAWVKRAALPSWKEFSSRSFALRERTTRYWDNDVDIATWEEVPDSSLNIDGEDYALLIFRMKKASKAADWPRAYRDLWNESQLSTTPLTQLVSIVRRTKPTFVEAAQDNDLPALNAYLKQGVDLTTEGPKAAASALKSNSDEALSLLLSAGVNIESEQAVRAALASNNIDGLQLALFSKTISKSGFGNALAEACEQKNVDIIKLLLRYEPATDDALHCAVRRDDVEVAQMLLVGGANPNSLVSSTSGREPMLVRAIRSGAKKVVSLLIERGATVDAENGLALELAVKYGNSVAIATLLEHGADANRIRDGVPVLFLGTYLGYPEIVELLLKHGANPDVTSDGSPLTPLSIAAWFGHTEVADALIAHNANVNIPDARGLTPLHMAIRSGDLELSKSLLVAGADPRAKASGQDSATMAKAVKDREAETLLRKWLAGDREGALAIVRVRSKTVRQKDFTMAETGENPIALRNELLNSLVFQHAYLLNNLPRDDQPLGIEDAQRERLEQELEILLGTTVSLYKQQHKCVEHYFGRTLNKTPKPTVQLLDHASAWAGIPDAAEPSILFTAKLIAANFHSSTRALRDRPALDSDDDDLALVRELRRQVRLHSGTTRSVHSSRPGSINLSVGFGNFEAGMADMERYIELVDLSQQLKPVETQYYGTFLFILSHELGHLLLEHGAQVSRDPENTALRKAVEMEADEFAALILARSLITLSVNVIPMTKQGFGSKNVRMLDRDMLDRYTGFSTFFTQTYERAHFQQGANANAYPSPEERLAATRLVVRRILHYEQEQLVDRAQVRQDATDMLRQILQGKGGILPFLP